MLKSTCRDPLKSQSHVRTFAGTENLPLRSIPAPKGHPHLPDTQDVVRFPSLLGGQHLRGCSSVVERHVANVNVGRSNRLTRFEESALPEPGGAFSWVERAPWFTPDSHPDAPDRTVSCTEVVAVLVTPCDLPVRDCQQPLEARGSVRNEALPSPHVVDEHRAKRSR